MSEPDAPRLPVTSWVATTDGETAAAHVKQQLGLAWSAARALVESGKLFVDDERVVRVDARVAAGQRLLVRMNAPRPRDPTREGNLVFDDAHVVVIDKPSGISSVPYDDRERGTAMDLVRAAWKRMGRRSSEVALHIVHRIDKGTSGLLMFAKSKRSEMALAEQLRSHSMERTYYCVAHGAVDSQRIESHLVADRGDGIRGSTRFPEQGKRAVTHVEAITRFTHATLCRVRLETGKTHQIRIHLSELGHPLVGEDVYSREFHRDGKRLLASGRLLLHAASLGFAHPATQEPVSLASRIPADFRAAARGFAAELPDEL